MSNVNQSLEMAGLQKGKPEELQDSQDKGKTEKPSIFINKDKRAKAEPISISADEFRLKQFQQIDDKLNQQYDKQAVIESIYKPKVNDVINEEGEEEYDGNPIDIKAGDLGQVSHTKPTGLLGNFKIPFVGKKNQSIDKLQKSTGIAGDLRRKDAKVNQDIADWRERM